MSNFKITVLGSGTMVADKDYNPAGFLVKADEKTILLDCGHGTIRRLCDYGFDYLKIDPVFISHYHCDHFGDCFNMVHTRWVADINKGKTDGELTLIGPKGMKERFKKWKEIYWREPKQFYKLNCLEGPKKIRKDNLEIETFEVKHVPYFQSVGISLIAGRKKLVYTGDLSNEQNLAELVRKANDADLLIVESAFIDPTKGHFSFTEVKELAKATRAKRVLIFHVKPQLRSEMKKLCDKEGFIFGQDGLKIEL